MTTPTRTRRNYLRHYALCGGTRTTTPLGTYLRALLTRGTQGLHEARADHARHLPPALPTVPGWTWRTNAWTGDLNTTPSPRNLTPLTLALVRDLPLSSEAALCVTLAPIGDPHPAQGGPTPGQVNLTGVDPKVHPDAARAVVTAFRRYLDTHTLPTAPGPEEDQALQGFAGWVTVEVNRLLAGRN